ncbi:integrase catalytic domain-containing protein [Nephila pilipes]|uniref:Integrase catalytic domain-containing protein n=1 Tax=Nephila pilipes TaxID=299642 RepID=A0A8X6TES7_NEPPI|nr:integrase catalytic domain-containing protein [Nephila pilipes]
MTKYLQNEQESTTLPIQLLSESIRINLDDARTQQIDVVLIESTAKRVNWPLRKVVQLIERKDAEVRLAKIRTNHNDLLRPIQRLYPLEVISSFDEDLRQQIEGHTICDKRDESNISSDSSP